jgi:hypothetical protein
VTVTLNEHATPAQLPNGLWEFWGSAAHVKVASATTEVDVYLGLVILWAGGPIAQNPCDPTGGKLPEVGLESPRSGAIDRGVVIGIPGRDPAWPDPGSPCDPCKTPPIELPTDPIAGAGARVPAVALPTDPSVPPCCRPLPKEVSTATTTGAASVAIWADTGSDVPPVDPCKPKLPCKFTIRNSVVIALPCDDPDPCRDVLGPVLGVSCPLAPPDPCRPPVLPSPAREIVEAAILSPGAVIPLKPCAPKTPCKASIGSYAVVVPCATLPASCPGDLSKAAVLKCAAELPARIGS